MPRIDRMVISCEHGGNRVPPPYRKLFAGSDHLLASHRGFDAGTLELGRRMARTMDCPIVVSQDTRLFVDLNRSATNPAVFSSITRRLPLVERREILARYHEPHRRRVQDLLVKALADDRRVLHVCVHSFTPVLEGKVRNADIGLLYDPRRPAERSAAAAWRSALLAVSPGLRVRMNYPYLGRSDGLVTHLRQRLGRRYVGIELEVNQRWVRRGSTGWRKLQEAVVASLRASLD